jgi:hypothetical protein
MISTGTALLAAASIGGSLYGSSKAAKAAKQAGDLQYQASQDAIAANNALQAQIRADNEPFRQYGLSAASALAGGLGLSTSGYAGGPGAPGMMTGGYSTGAQSAASDGVDWNAYLQQNPDALANFRDIQSQGRTDTLATDPIAFAKFHYQDDGARRELPMLAAPTAPENPTTPGTAAGYTDPTAPNGYTMPARPMTEPLDVSIGAFRESPDYQFRFNEGNRALGAISSVAGGRMSGQRLKAAERFGSNIADGEYTDWRNYRTGRFDTDRAFTEQAYLNDRSNLNQRYDTRNSTLLSMAGFGTGATSANNQAAMSTTQANNQATMTGAQAQGGAAVGAANAWNQGINNIMTAGAYAWGNRPTANPTPSIKSAPWTAGIPSYMQTNPMTGMTGRY